MACLLCWSPNVTPTYLQIDSAEGIEPLRRQLTHWFILRRVLELPLEWCENYLLLQDNEEDWLQVCTNCLNSFVQEFWQIHQQIVELEDKRRRLQKKLKRKMEEGAVNCTNPSDESGGIAMEIRTLVVPGIEEMVLRRIEQQEQVKREEESGTDEPEISDDDWQPMDDEEKELATEEKHESSQFQRKVGNRKLYKRPLKRTATGLPPRKRKKKCRAKRFIYPCEQCSVRAFEFLEDFQRHQRLHTERKLVPAVDSNGQSLDCQLCSFPAADSQELLLHTRVRHERMSWNRINYECPLAPAQCNKVPSEWTFMFAHVTKMHPEEVQEQLFQRYLYCDQCPFKGRLPRILQVHKRREHGNGVQEPPLETEQGLKCPNCDILCATQKELKFHVNNQHRRVSRFLCGVCGKGFLSECKLKDHEVTHTKNQTREWVCHVCGVDYPRESTLTWHLSKYHGPENETEGKDVKLFRCRYCDLTSPYGPVIRRHLQTHKEAGQWKCELCGKFYMNKQGLLRHQRINHNESGERVKCPNCKRDFPSRDGLTVHLRRHCKLKGSK